MSKSKVPAWLPDWKNVSAYQKTHIEYTWLPKPSLDQPAVSTIEQTVLLPIEEWPWQVWVWEFLRRNTEYQADYECFVSLPDFHAQGHSLENYLMEKWSITHLVDPAKDDGYRIFGPDIEMPPYHLQIERLIDRSGYVSPLPPPDEPEHVTLRFDLRYGIDAQLEKAKETLLYWRDHLKKGLVPYTLDKTQSEDHLDKLPAYLRAFDAALAGTTVRETGETLFPTDVDDEARRKKAGRAVESGKALVNGGYKDLIRFR
ncbi:MAG: hypothetical protein ABS69_11565 [Nitrosomonadales bacterium SCN 54-20]|nr:MAG: hypothetical protein ABS69_11565 [Nitrosomonadales bacterium SCN 54-20]